MLCFPNIAWRPPSGCSVRNGQVAQQSILASPVQGLGAWRNLGRETGLFWKFAHSGPFVSRLHYMCCRWPGWCPRFEPHSLHGLRPLACIKAWAVYRKHDKLKNETGSRCVTQRMHAQWYFWNDSRRSVQGEGLQEKALGKQANNLCPADQFWQLRISSSACAQDVEQLCEAKLWVAISRAVCAAKPVY